MGKVGESITLSWQINYKKWKIKIKIKIKKRVKNKRENVGNRWMMWLNMKVVIINVMLQFLDIHRLERERDKNKYLFEDKDRD